MAPRAGTLWLVHNDVRPRRALADAPLWVRGLLALAGAFLLCSGPWSSSLQAQNPRKALSKDEVIGLLESGVPPARVGQLAHQYGLAFAATPDVENELRDAGASDELLDALRKLGPKNPLSPSPPASSKSPAGSPGPPILLIEATPGGAEVYIDDEPVGTTSSSGRLKLSHLSPGEHRVRLSLSGHRDYESSVTLAAGTTTPFAATLDVAGAPSAANPLAAGSSAAASGSQAASASGPATLGVLLAAQAPAGRRGAYISDVAPGGPAEKAGLRAGFSILMIQDQPINSPQDAQQAMSQFQPGTTVRITYSDGQNIQTTQAQLAARSGVTLPATPTAPPTSGSSQTGTPGAGIVSFNVAHDHGAGGTTYCVGIMTIGGGMIRYRSTDGLHSFDFPLSAVRQARRNAVYLAVFGAFHIRLKTGGNYNFVLHNAAGLPVPPDPVLLAIEQALAHR
jgi:hypothetical protein